MDIDSDIERLIELCDKYTTLNRLDSVLYYAGKLGELPGDRAFLYSNLYTGQSMVLSTGSPDAFVWLDRALSVSRLSTDTVALCKLYNAIAIYKIDSELNFYEGIDYFIKSLNLSGGSYPKQYLIALCNLAYAYYMRNDMAGLKYSEEAYRLAVEEGDGHIAFSSAVITAYQHYIRGDMDIAMDYLLETLSKTDVYGCHTEVYALYANILHTLGRDGEALDYYRKSVSHIGSATAVATIMAWLSYGTYLLDTGDYTGASSAIDSGIELAVRHRLYSWLYMLYLRKSQLQESVGDYREALKYFKMYQSESDSIFSLEREHSINELRLKYEAEQRENKLKEKELSLVRWQKKLWISVILSVFFASAAIGIFIYFRKREKMYGQMVRQRLEKLEKESVSLKGGGDSDKDERNSRIFGEIEKLMKEEKLYADPNLTIDRIAGIMKMNRTYISNAINSKTGGNFNNYVNTYRIDEAVRRLSDMNDNAPLKAIAMDIGYNHIQTFSSTFSKYIGMSPVKFREKSHEIKKERTVQNS
ncbi:MAG TPA: helix-turn-helix transcriptional regulator [Candidatus Coprenecus stercoravium]|uniref:Helix-turn-helix transcriptional regulator n=1 Tax=Candidatus Coprenecus stercoravium TaxID=2840735 RepID=A0A9D2K9R3_9BACT|nr:helix-turn-helix transcriptional regulator [Candidatus Coprenecus stercoravium]